MDLSFQTLTLTLHEPFTISRGTQTTADNIIVTLSDGEHTGLGEAAPAERYGEFAGSVQAFLTQLQERLAGTNHLPLTSLHALMSDVADLNPSAKAAVDMAAYDLLGKQLNVPVYQLLGLDHTRTPRTSFTLGIDTPAAMARKAREAHQYPVLKIKVGTDRDTENLEAIRAVRPDATIYVDANEAWTPKQAVERIEALSIYDLAFVEQPVDAANLEGLGFVTSSVALPVFADESCVVPHDVPRIAPYVDGINIKLMKCGGLYPALQMICLARAHHLQVMMGCMIESSIAITAAAQLSPLLDYADLDGHLLIDDDPYRGAFVSDGRLMLSTSPGLGLQPA